MTSDLILFLAKANLALAAAVLLALVLRKPVRAAFGARSAYALWLIVPLSILALLIPARTVTLPAPVGEPTASVVTTQAPPSTKGRHQGRAFADACPKAGQNPADRRDHLGPLGLRRLR